MTAATRYVPLEFCVTLKVIEMFHINVTKLEWNLSSFFKAISAG